MLSADAQEGPRVHASRSVSVRWSQSIVETVVARAALLSIVMAGATIGIAVASARGGSAPPTSPSQIVRQAEARHDYGMLPLSFEPNVGQAPDAARFVAHGGGYTAELESGGALLVPDGGGTPVQMRLVGARTTPATSSGERLPGVVNYLIGSDATKWHTNVPTYGAVTYHDVYRGIDMVWHGPQGAPEYDFLVAPGTDASVITLAFAGADSVRIDTATGDLLVAMPQGTMRQHAPQMYQDRGTQRDAISGNFVMRSASTVGFVAGAYDTSRPLTIDPAFTYSTYLGGSSQDSGHGIAVDPAGDAYVVGTTCSADFPTVDPIMSFSGQCNAFVSKLNADGTALQYSTYIGGAASGGTEADGVAVDGSGSVDITGLTTQSDFPTTADAAQACSTGAPQNAFAAQLNGAGSSLVYATCLGGSRLTQGFAIQAHAGHIFVDGFTGAPDFPVTPGAVQTVYGGNTDAFVTEIDPAVAGAAGIVYSTYLGGSDQETNNGNYSGFGLAVDDAGIIYVVGSTHSTDFPVTGGAFQASLTNPSSGGQDAFISKINPVGGGRSDLVYSTYLGGSGGDAAVGVALGPPQLGSSMPTIYVTGNTYSPNDFPTTAGAVQTAPICGGVACPGFVSKLNPAGSGASDLLYSTFFGANGATTWLRGMAVNPNNGDAVVVGETNGSNLPTMNPVQATCGCFSSLSSDWRDVFVTEIRPDPSGSASGNLIFSTFVGGTGDDRGFAVAVDGAGSIYLTGAADGAQPTGSKRFPRLPFPTTNGALQSTFGGGGNPPQDAFVTKISFADLSVSGSVAPSPATVRRPMTYTLVAANAGPSAATAVLTAVLPARATFVSASPGCTLGSKKAHMVTCQLGAIAAGGSTSVAITVAPGAKGTATSTVSVAGGPVDTSPGDNSATMSVVVNP